MLSAALQMFETILEERRQEFEKVFIKQIVDSVVEYHSWKLMFLCSPRGCVWKRVLPRNMKVEIQ